MAFAERAAIQKNFPNLIRDLLTLLILGSGSIALRFVEFQFLQCRWDDNAYGSIVWALMVVHLSYLIACVLEVALLVLWIWMYGLDDKQVVDVTLSAAYWYWTVAVWLLLYAVIYWTPRMT
ncbi:MAG: cytochrome oxidase subunit [Planctomycetaceae bacterium]|nr:cytochrome oxidase subunit [Planctomycetaceae bacterium]